MFAKVVACGIAVLFALCGPADALFGGGGGGKGGGGKGGGSKGSSSSSSKSSSKSKSRGGVSAGVSAGRGGVSAGASVGGARAGASLGGGGISAGASAGGVSAGTSVGGGGAAASVSGGGTSISATAGTGGISVTTGATDNSAEPAQQQAGITASASFLPWALLPLSAAGCDTASECEILTGRAAAVSRAYENTLDPDGNIPLPIVSSCQRAAAEAAQGYGALKVEAASAGRIKRSAQGGVVAPVSMRITYALADGGTQVRQAEVNCTVGGNGRVLALN